MVAADNNLRDVDGNDMGSGDVPLPFFVVDFLEGEYYESFKRREPHP